MPASRGLTIYDDDVSDAPAPDPGDTPAVPSPRAASSGLRAYEVVLQWVDEQILGGHLRVGDQLPAERELAASLEVSRSAVREAVRTLQAQGVVRSAVGAGAAGGTTITAVPSDALARLLRLHVALANFPLPDVIEVRIALERLSVRLAATSAGPADLDRLRTLLDVMDDPDIARERFNDHDTEFHVAIATSAGNRVATDLTVAIRESMRLPILDRFRRLDEWDDVVRELRDEHAAIFAALAAGDAATAQRLMEAHIRSAWRAIDP
ncbi:GntR family transcriptional regulator [Terracoccus luteus]|uniref:GntR family transcriptional regulator n=1 Tax=Terracoccus luteus TaxID=53356 RepID=A0A495XZU3_9MICO|nr:GntR family transcriptional regulator [Terracoccus luteus]